MGHRLSRITTRTGDDGTTGLANGERLPKTDPRFDAMGDLDELNCQIGVVLSLQPMPCFADPLRVIQHRLFDMGGELAIPGYAAITDEHVAALDALIETFNADLPPLKEFVLPGGGALAAQMHLARAVSRRAERSVWRVAQAASAGQPHNAASLRYLNRLSDILFVFARHFARADGAEITWQRC